MFKIFDEKEDSTVVLKLVRFGEIVTLAAVNKSGDVVAGGYLLRFNDDGTFTRRYSVAGNVGVKVKDGYFVERT